MDDDYDVYDDDMEQYERRMLAEDARIEAAASAHSDPYYDFMRRFFLDIGDFDPDYDIASQAEHLVKSKLSEPYTLSDLEDRYCQILSEARMWMREGLALEDILTWIEHGAK